MTNPLDDKFADRYDPTRHHDENHGIQNQPADKFADRSSAARTAPRLPGPAERESPVPSLTAARSPRLGLSLTQILGSTGAAVTAAFLGSRLGVAGTLIGAALASVISVVGGAVYTSSIKATKLRVAQAIVAVRVPDGGVGSPGTPRPAPIPTPAAPRPPEPARVPQANQRSRRPALRGAVAASLLCTAVFAGTLVVVTGYESVSGNSPVGRSGRQSDDSRRAGPRRVCCRAVDDHGAGREP